MWQQVPGTVEVKVAGAASSTARVDWRRLASTAERFLHCSTVNQHASWRRPRPIWPYLQTWQKNMKRCIICIYFITTAITIMWSINIFNTLTRILKLKKLHFAIPHYLLRDVITIQPSRVTQSSFFVILLSPPVQLTLKITYRSFWHATPQLWNKLPAFRVSYQSVKSHSSPPLSGSDSGPVVHISHAVFQSSFKNLKTQLFSKSFPLQPPVSTMDGSHGV